MVKFATSVLAVTLLAGSALAFSAEQQYERSVDDVVLTREDLYEHFGREFVDDIEERSPFGLGLLFKGIKGIAKIAKKGHHHAHVGGGNDNNQRREFEDMVLEVRDSSEALEERDPFGLGLLFKGIKGIAKIAKKGHHHGGGGGGNDNNQRREFEEMVLAVRDLGEEALEERDPFGLGLLFKGVKAAVKLGKAAHDHKNRNRRELTDELEDREFDDSEEMLEREYDDMFEREYDDMFEREFDDAEEMFERDFDDEILEREYYDELD